MKALLGVVISVSALISVGTANAKSDSKSAPAQSNTSSAGACTLIFGGDQANPGAMLQYLRSRERGASGNPKEVADAYPDEFDNVGDLIQQKCEQGRK